MVKFQRTRNVHKRFARICPLKSQGSHALPRTMPRKKAPPPKVKSKGKAAQDIDHTEAGSSVGGSGSWAYTANANDSRKRKHNQGEGSSSKRKRLYQHYVSDLVPVGTRSALPARKQS